MLKSQIRGAIRDYIPALDALLHSRGQRKHFRETFYDRQSAMKLRLYGDQTPQVLTGPFKGLRYLDEIVWGPIEPKWLGTYELELHGLIDAIVETGYATIIDIGSAEGFYSVGLAHRLPLASVHSFDIDPWARAQQRRLARLNSVKNLKLGRLCASHDIERLRDGRTLVVCDIEGHEYDLLDRHGAPGLGQCDVLVETHPNAKRGLSALTGADYLADHFAPSHDTVMIEVARRSPDLVARVPALTGFSQSEIEECLDEARDFEQRWLWLKARDVPPTG